MHLDPLHEGTRSSFRDFGPGISNYFKFLKFMFWTFIILTMIQLPAMALYWSGGYFVAAPESTASSQLQLVFLWLSPGNMGLYTTNASEATASFSHEAVEVFLDRESAVGLAAALDGLAAAVLLIALMWLRQAEQVEALELASQTLGAHSFSHWLAGALPASTRESDIGEALQRHAGVEPHCIHLIPHLGHAAALRTERRALFDRMEEVDCRLSHVLHAAGVDVQPGEAEAFAHAALQGDHEKDATDRSGSGSSEGAACQKVTGAVASAGRSAGCAVQLSLEQRRFVAALLSAREHMSKRVLDIQLHVQQVLDERPSQGCFVVWSTQQDKQAFEASLGGQGSTLLCLPCVAREANLSDDIQTKVEACPKPSNIEWGNIGVPWFERVARRATSTACVCILLLCTITTLYHTRKLKADKEAELAIAKASGRPGSFPTAEVLPFVTPLVVVTVNALLVHLVTKVVAFERHSRKDFVQLRVFEGLLYPQFINSALLAITVNADFQQAVSALGLGSVVQAGAFSDFTPEWFKDVGTSMVVTMLYEALAAYTIPITKLLVRSWRLRAVETGRVTVWSQRELDRLFTFPRFSLAVRMGQVFSAIFVCLIFSAVLPVLLPVGALVAGLAFWFDKTMLCRVLSSPLHHDNTIPQKASQVLIVALVLRSLLGMWMLTSGIFINGRGVPLEQQFPLLVRNTPSSFSAAEVFFDRILEVNIIPHAAVLCIALIWGTRKAARRLAASCQTACCGRGSAEGLEPSVSFTSRDGHGAAAVAIAKAALASTTFLEFQAEAEGRELTTFDVAAAPEWADLFQGLPALRTSRQIRVAMGERAAQTFASRWARHQHAHWTLRCGTGLRHVPTSAELELLQHEPHGTGRRRPAHCFRCARRYGWMGAQGKSMSRQKDRGGRAADSSQHHSDSRKRARTRPGKVAPAGALVTQGQNCAHKSSTGLAGTVNFPSAQGEGKPNRIILTPLGDA